MKIALPAQIQLTFALMLTICFTNYAATQEPTADIKLDNSNFVAWRDFILPTQAELEFLKIPWRRTLKDAVIDAGEQDRPVLLWSMNGHPLGCT